MYRADQVRSSFDFVSLSRCAERARAAGLLPHRSDSQIPMPKREKRSKADAGSTVELSASLKIDADDESATSGNDRCDFNTESWGHRCRTSAITSRAKLYSRAKLFYFVCFQFCVEIFQKFALFEILYQTA